VLDGARAQRHHLRMNYLNDCGGKFKCPLKDDTGQTVATLLWGDPLQVLQRSGTRVQVHARGRPGWVDAAFVGADGEPGLLELYIIDVGQGDGVLMRTPHDNAWHLIDAGVRGAAQMTKKGAANFVRWKFIKELRLGAVKLAHVVVTHPDEDHFGGMLDVLSGTLADDPEGQRSFKVQVDNFWHCGMGRFAGDPPLGATRKDTSTTPLPHTPAPPTPAPRAAGTFITELLDGKTHFKAPARPFAAEPRSRFATLAQWLGKVPAKVKRLHHGMGWLPGYAPPKGQGVPPGITTIRVLGPVLEKLAGGGVGLRTLGSESETRNGHSVVLRVDHGAARILLTGDLNSASQALLLAVHGAAEFEVDVAKGCHHGSDDVDLNFVRAMAARATVVSSGDNEDYAHPRPRVLGASARYGRESVAPPKAGKAGEVLPPLLYSTELARSVQLAYARALRKRGAVGPPATAAGADQDASSLEARFVARTQGDDYKRLAWLPMATDLVYGLVNVRTDGRRILLAYMSEGSSDFDLRVFMAGQAPG
jgi:beta-lactamase superfamily II metal-dependent hydrolase